MNQGMLSLLLAIAASAIGPADVLPAEGTEQEPKWLETVWTAEVGEDIYESPEVQGGRVYAANSCGAVTSLDLTSGKVLARTTFDLGSNHRLPIQVAATPDGLFLARGHLVRRCDLTNLETVWSADLGESHQCLAVAGGRLLTTTYPDVILLDAESGKVIWRKKVGSQGRGVLLGGNFALYASNTEECRFLDLVTGETRWTARAEEYCHALALGPGVVYYGSGAYRLKDGSALWTVDAPAQQWSAGPGFAVGVFAKNQLAAVEGASGKLLWTWTAPGGTGAAQIPLRQAPAIVNGKVVASVEEGLVAVLDAEDGQVIASRVLDASEPAGRRRGLNCFPVIAGGLLLASSNGGRVFALRFPDEAASWTGNGGGPRRLSEAYEPDPVKLASAEPGCDFGGKEDEGE